MVVVIGERARARHIARIKQHRIRPASVARIQIVQLSLPFLPPLPSSLEVPSFSAQGISRLHTFKSFSRDIIKMAPSIDPRAVGKQPLHDLPTPEPESPLRPRKPYKFSTLCATVENPDMKDQYGSSSVPIYQTATFKGVAGEYDYSRSGNPTRSHLRECSLLCFSSINFTQIMCRTPHCQNFIGIPCIYCLVRHGRFGHYSPSAQARR